MTETAAQISPVDLYSRPDLVAQLRGLAESAADADGYGPFSEQFLLGLEDARLGHRHLLATAGGEVAGAVAFAAPEGGSADAELFVAPQFRRRGVGSALYDALLAACPAPQVWAHGNLPAARALAARKGLGVVRRLLVMELAGAALEVAGRGEISLPAEMRVGTLAEAENAGRREAAERAWLEVNNEAFAWHPEQGGWDLERLRRAQEVAWFDPADVLFLWDEAEDSRRARLAGFHWIKWHREGEPAYAETYVVGLADAYRGRGLGGPLMELGLQHMVSQGAEKVILYVEADNAPAVRAYERLGFAVSEEHCVWGQQES